MLELHLGARREADAHKGDIAASLAATFDCVKAFGQARLSSDPRFTPPPPASVAFRRAAAGGLLELDRYCRAVQLDYNGETFEGSCQGSEYALQ